MTSPIQKRRLHSYDEAIAALNGLQSNAATLAKAKEERQRNIHLNVPRATTQLIKSGLTLEELDSLKVIHVAGTKGKGSTCAFVESILRRNGLKTGFFSSPHLVTVTERIRLNGVPISQEKFTAYFWSVYEKIAHLEERPPYFQFLTILALNIFHRERVDVAILEVGIGGEYDSTNVVRRPCVTAITALGLDHTQILGSTIAEIAWNKAGIMKAGVPCFVDGHQQPEALEVIAERCREREAAGFHLVPVLSDYDWGPFPRMEIGLQGNAQKRNASVALQVSRYFLDNFENSDNRRKNSFSPGAPFKLDINEVLGLRLTQWPGRTQKIEFGEDLTFFLDGAHTKESVMECEAWFKDAVDSINNNKIAARTRRNSVSSPKSVLRILVFNTIDVDRAVRMFETLAKLRDLDFVIFTTNYLRTATSESDNMNFTTTVSGQLKRAEQHLEMWNEMKARGKVSAPALVLPYINDALAFILPPKSSTRYGFDLNMDAAKIAAAAENESSSISSDLRIRAAESGSTQILVTGSIHLIGGVLEIIKPDICDVTPEQVHEEVRLTKVYTDLASK